MIITTEGTFQHRVVDEAEGLQKKVIKLEDFINNNLLYKKLSKDEQDRLSQQLKAMKYYLTILIKRIQNLNKTENLNFGQVIEV